MASQLSNEITFGSMGLVKWLSKLPEPLVTQTHEPKMKVAPLGGVTVLKAKVAIELAESPTWRASCHCLLPSLLRDTLSSRVCKYGSTALELDGARNTKIYTGLGRELHNTLRPVWWFVLP